MVFTCCFTLSTQAHIHHVVVGTTLRWGGGSLLNKVQDPDAVGTIKHQVKCLGWTNTCKSPTIIIRPLKTWPSRRHGDCFDHDLVCA